MRPPTDRTSRVFAQRVKHPYVFSGCFTTFVGIASRFCFKTCSHEIAGAPNHQSNSDCFVVNIGKIQASTPIRQRNSARSESSVSAAMCGERADFRRKLRRKVNLPHCAAKLRGSPQGAAKVRLPPQCAAEPLLRRKGVPPQCAAKGDFCRKLRRKSALVAGCGETRHSPKVRRKPVRCGETCRFVHLFNCQRSTSPRGGHRLPAGGRRGHDACLYSHVPIFKRIQYHISTPGGSSLLSHFQARRGIFAPNPRDPCNAIPPKGCRTALTVGEQELLRQRPTTP
jgi:hypothetical protein